jgi:hypothetical protein
MALGFAHKLRQKPFQINGPTENKNHCCFAKMHKGLAVRKFGGQTAQIPA